MAVTAADIALLDLTPELGGRARMDEAADLGHLVSRGAMIEFEDNGIRFAAVDAGVGRQIRSDDAPILEAIDGRMRFRLGQIDRDVVPVVLLPVLATAGPAVRPIRASRGVLDREVSQRLRD